MQKVLAMRELQPPRSFRLEFPLGGQVSSMVIPSFWSCPLLYDLEVFRCASVLTDLHCVRATKHAAQSERVILAKEGAAGVAVWQRIRNTIAEIERVSPNAASILTDTDHPIV